MEHLHPPLLRTSTGPHLTLLRGRDHCIKTTTTDGIDLSDYGNDLASYYIAITNYYGSDVHGREERRARTRARTRRRLRRALAPAAATSPRQHNKTICRGRCDPLINPLFARRTG